MLYQGTLFALIVLLFPTFTANVWALDFKIIFPDAKEIEKGNKVILSGVIIGEVKDVVLNNDDKVIVALQINDKYSHRIFTNTQFVIISEKHRIRASNKKKPDTLLKNGALVKGSSETKVLLDGTREEIKDLVSSFKAGVDVLLEDIGINEIDKQISIFLSILERFSADMRTMGEKEYKNFREDVLPWVNKKIRELEQNLQALGEGDKAKKFKTDVEKRMEDIKRSI